MPLQPWLVELRRYAGTIAIQLLVPLLIVAVMRALGVGPWDARYAPGGVQDASEAPAAPYEQQPFAEL